EGETASIVRSVEPDGWRDPGDPAGIARWLLDRLEGKPLATAADRPAIRDGFQRRAQAGQLAALLERVVEQPCSSSRTCGPRQNGATATSAHAPCSRRCSPTGHSRCGATARWRGVTGIALRRSR